MDETSLRAALKRDGYDRISVTNWPASTTSQSHTHNFDVRGIVLSGTFTVTTDVSAMACQPGDQFNVAANTPHTETVGPDGARVLIGRRA